MILVRDARVSDLSGVLKLARHLDSYNLPADRDKLRDLLRVSEASFAGRLKDAGRRKYLFVAENTRTRELAGSSLVIERHGTPELPHLSFRVGRVARRSRTLNKSVEHATIQLKADRTGFTEIGGLVVLPKYRHSDEHIARKLSFARFAYIARHRARFRPRVLIEFMPRIDHEAGNNLWKFVGGHFTGLTYGEADRLSATNKEFILSLFPRERMYCCTLPFSAMRLIGTLAPGARASLRILRRMGFRFSGHVDPFDGGPHYVAKLAAIPLVRQSRRAWYSGQWPAQFFPDSAMVLVERAGRVRALEAPCSVERGRLCLDADAATVLGLKNGDQATVTRWKH